MRITFCCADTRAPEWLSGLRAALPQADVSLWQSGAHLVDDNLLELVDSGHLAGATLDVFRTEPLPPQHPFWAHPKITVTPHISARTLVDESIAQIAGKIAALERVEPARGLVDSQRGH